IMKKVWIGIGLWIMVGLSSALYAQDLVDCVSESANWSASSTNGTSPVPEGTRCYTGRDSNGAYYMIAIPQNWNGTLFLFSHGGPDPNYKPLAPLGIVGLGPALPLVAQGYAGAATGYSRNGWAMGTNALDIENLRQIFAKKFGRPKRTFLTGGSYAGGVLGLVVERY